MSSTKRKIDVVTFPLTVFETAGTKDDLEDWLLAHDQDFIKKVRKAREYDLNGEGKDWDEVKKELCIK